MTAEASPRHRRPLRITASINLFPQLRLPIWFSLLIFIFASTISAQRETITIKTSEGTELAFDISPDGRSIVFDLLGQLWMIPAAGGQARPITNAVRDTAEDSDPSFAPDGRQLIFRGERNGRTGLWLLTPGLAPRQVTQVPNPDGFDRDASWSPDGHTVSFEHAVPPSAPGGRWRTTIMLLNVATGTTRELAISNIPTPFLCHPVWLHDGARIAFIAAKSPAERSGRTWIVNASGGAATPVTPESIATQNPSFTNDGRRLAYFAPDSNGHTQLWVQDLNNDNINKFATRLTDEVDVTASRVRWTSDGRSLLYSANGRLWKVASTGSRPTEIPFNATLKLTRLHRTLPQASFPEPGRAEHARGFMGLALSPDGRQIGMLALGKLWVIPIDGTPRAITAVPFEASSLAWSPDSTEVAWSAGIADNEDLFATNLVTGATRRLTSLPGREAFPTYSPDGRYLAFIHMKDDGVLRVIDARANNISDVGQTRDLGSIGLSWTSPPQWSPESSGLLVCAPAVLNQPGRATFVELSGQRREISNFPDAPIFLQWTSQQIVYVRHDRLWKAPFDLSGTQSEPQPIGDDPALYASSAKDGTLLFVSDGGLRLRSPDGSEKKLGWPLTYSRPMADSLLIRNVRIIDGTGGPIVEGRDIWIEKGRISRIGPTGTIPSGNARVLDANGRTVIPGLMDLHAHTYRPDLLPGFLYFGITTVRDQGSSMAPLVSYRDDISAGLLPGPRVDYGGFQFYSDWPFDEEQGRGIEPEADAGHVTRSVALAQAFGAQHIKTRTFRRWDINSRMIAEAHRRGMRATGHCSQQLPLIAAGMDAKEHTGACEARGDRHVYDDLIQLFRAAGIGVVPTIVYRDFAVRLNERPALLDDDPELAPFLPTRDNFGWMFKLNVVARQQWLEERQLSREETAKLARAGVILGTGTDIWQIPTGTHMELEQLVIAGLSPAQALRAGTGSAARILGAEKDLGTIEVGKWADLVLLDADPLTDIRNTRRIWQVIHYGQLVDRAAILKVMRPR